MRLTLCALTAIALSGCSWLDEARTGHPGHTGYGPQSAHVGHSAYKGHQQPAYTPRRDYAAGFQQKPDFSNYNAGSGYHTQSAGVGTGSYVKQSSEPAVKTRKRPRLRGSLSLGIEKSIGGDFLDYDAGGFPNPATTYDPDVFSEGFVEGSPADGEVTTTIFSSDIEEIVRPNISFEDVYSTPMTVSAGLEYIVSPKFTVYANGGYTAAEGNSGEVIKVMGELHRDTTVQSFDTNTGAPLGPPVSNRSFIPNQEVARFSYDFSDLKRVDLEVGGRYYFDPIVKDQGFRTVTPFVSASAGAKHYNGQSYTISQQQRFYQRAFDSNGATEDFFNVLPGPQPRTVDVTNSGWVPAAKLMAGMEWQVTPTTALAVETGLQFEGSRDFANGADGDENLSVPLNIRGSFNF